MLVPSSDAPNWLSPSILGPVALIVAVSVGYESMFVHHGLNHLDESWPLYAGMQMQAGGRLYDDVLWVFPPAHALVGWLAHAIDPPGFETARRIYAAFSVALSVGVFVLARRLTTLPFALLAGLLVAVAGPRSHHSQLLFGYRYLILCVFALLAFDKRLRTGNPRWLVVAGVWTGVAVVFRLTPAFATGCGIAVATLAADPNRRIWLRDWTRFGVGIAIPLVPVLAWFQYSVGLGTLWHEVVIHPLGMLQALPAPPIGEWNWADRESISRWFVAVQFRAHWFLFGAYALALVGLWLRAVRRRQPYRHALLLAIVVFGAVFFIRSLGRSDEPHLDSVIAPVCLLVACGLGSAFDRCWPRALMPAARIGAAIALCGIVLGSWIYLLGTDLYFSRERRGTHRVYTAEPDAIFTNEKRATAFDQVASLIEEHTSPGDRILSLAPTPIFHVLTDRLGPGYADLIMPGIFLSADSERQFVRRLRASPPAAIIWPGRFFDDMPERAVDKTAPRVAAWARSHYRRVGPFGEWMVMIPRQGVRRPEGRRG